MVGSNIKFTTAKCDYWMEAIFKSKNDHIQLFILRHLTFWQYKPQINYYNYAEGEKQVYIFGGGFDNTHN